MSRNERMNEAIKSQQRGTDWRKEATRNQMRLMRWRIVYEKANMRPRGENVRSPGTASLYYIELNFFFSPSVSLFFFFSLSLFLFCTSAKIVVCCCVYHYWYPMGSQALVFYSSGNLATKVELEEMQEGYGTYTCKLQRKQLSHNMRTPKEHERKEATKQAKISKHPQIK